LAADETNRSIRDLPMSGDGSLLLVHGVLKYGMIAALSEEAAIVFSHVPFQIDSLYAGTS
jgi:hypothetical protein